MKNFKPLAWLLVLAAVVAKTAQAAPPAGQSSLTEQAAVAGQNPPPGNTLVASGTMSVPEVPRDKGAIDAAGKFVATGSTPTRTAAEAAADETRQRESLKVLPDGPDRYRIGGIALDRARREVTIPATVNKVDGALEYALVAETGKLHEALFATKANPREIHLACLLLGIPTEEADKSSPHGIEVKVNVSWDTNGPTVLHELANLVVTADRPDAAANSKPLASGPWRYTSSTIGPAGFAAAVEGSVISLIQDPAALVVNPRDDARQDDIHTANPSLIPPKGSPVRIILTLPKPSAAPAKP